MLRRAEEIVGAREGSGPRSRQAGRLQTAARHWQRQGGPALVSAYRRVTVGLASERLRSALLCLPLQVGRLPKLLLVLVQGGGVGMGLRSQYFGAVVAAAEGVQKLARTPPRLSGR